MKIRKGAQGSVALGPSRRNPCIAMKAGGFGWGSLKS